MLVTQICGVGSSTTTPPVTQPNVATVLIIQPIEQVAIELQSTVYLVTDLRIQPVHC